MRFRFAALLPVVVLAIAFGDSSALGQVKWTNASGDSQWTNPKNWSTGTLPGPDDTVVFDDSVIGSNRFVDLAGTTQNASSLYFNGSAAPYTLAHGILGAGFVSGGRSGDVIATAVIAGRFTDLFGFTPLPGYTQMTYSGVISGAPTSTSDCLSASGVIFTASNTYSLPTTVRSPGLVLAGTSGSINQSPTVNVYGGLLLDNTMGVNNDRLGDTANIHMMGGTLEIDSNSSTDLATETIGTLSADAGGTLKTVSNGGGSTLFVKNLIRSNGSTLVLDPSGTTPSLSHLLIGNTSSLQLAGGSQWGTPNVSIVPFIVGPGAALATYDFGPDGQLGTPDDVGLRLLSPATEYLSTIPAGNQTASNVRLAANATMTESATINALSMNGATLTLNSGKQLTVSSGTAAMAGSSGALSVFTGGGSLALGGSEAVLTTEGLATQTGSQPRYVLDVPVSATGTLVKTGTGTLVLTHSNSLTGGVTIALGTLVSATTGSLGSGTIAFASGTLAFESVNQSLGNAFSFVGASNAQISVANLLQVELSGNISGGRFFKFGQGTLRLNGRASFDVSANVSEGGLRIDGEIPSVGVYGGILSGSGMIDDGLSVFGGTVSPGTGSPTGTSTFTVGSLDEQQGIYRPMLAGVASDQLRVTDDANVEGSELDVQVGTPLVVGQRFTIIDNTSSNPTNGPFKGLFEGSTFFVDGNEFQITYQGGDGNDVVLTVLSVPEPSMGLAAIFGAAGLLLRRRISRPRHG